LACGVGNDDPPMLAEMVVPSRVSVTGIDFSTLLKFSRNKRYHRLRRGLDNVSLPPGGQCL